MGGVSKDPHAHPQDPPLGAYLGVGRCRFPLHAGGQILSRRRFRPFRLRRFWHGIGGQLGLDPQKLLRGQDVFRGVVENVLLEPGGEGQTGEGDTRPPAVLAQGMVRIWSLRNLLQGCFIATGVFRGDILPLRV